ncbi:hypothetical protein [Limnoglobus roseus]|uniref:PEP-CTERM sorting domain-containing protein n=1 Tax=Limnoglobus roseus TaxID=2598579 RepID=A0A5C1ACQ0_9BACT|nr:hypothetical protein [Limnoglobus roseus]QEL15542.1 hypothetical protein PX52LOC_02467 [Limnoglobus roseus]
MKSLRKVFLTSFAFLGLCVFAGRSDATFQVNIAATSYSSVTVTDQVFVTPTMTGDGAIGLNAITAASPVPMTSLTTGIIFNITGGGLTGAYFEVQFSANTTGSATPYALNTTTANVIYHPGAAALSGADAAKLTNTTFTITITDTGLTAPTGPQISMTNSLTAIGSGLSPASPSSATYSATAGTLTTTTANISVATNGFSYNSNPPSATGSVPNPYVVQATLTLNPIFANNTAQQNLFSTASTSLAAVVPAPPALLLGVIGMPALALARRFRRTTGNTLAA